MAFKSQEIIEKIKLKVPPKILVNQIHGYVLRRLLSKLIDLGIFLLHADYNPNPRKSSFH